jgi:glycerol-3-phosphate dehydrogenase (NAD(P)+)
MSNTKKIAVVGSGSWGTALAVMLSRNGYNVDLWGHQEKHIGQLNIDRENKKYLPGILFPENLHLVSDLKDAIRSAHIVVMVVPSHAFREIFVQVSPILEDWCRVVSAVKGIENGTLQTMTQVMAQILTSTTGKKREIEFGVLSGPSFAQEVANNVPTAVTIGFKNIATAQEIQKVFVNEYFRVYASSDVIGLEVSASLKNVIAVAAGVCEGLGYGLNTRAALITRGLAEIKRLGIALGAEEATFSGLSGLGDLLLTCTGNLSRNRMVGLKLGEGKQLDQIQKEMSMVAEGIKTTLSAYELAKKMDIEMPILEQIYMILYRNKSCQEAVRDLLQRELKVE